MKGVYSGGEERGMCVVGLVCVCVYVCDRLVGGMKWVCNEERMWAERCRTDTLGMCNTHTFSNKNATKAKQKKAIG